MAPPPSCTKIRPDTFRTQGEACLFLLHFPILCAFGAGLASVDKSPILSLPVMKKWGFGGAMISCAYPRLRLIEGGTACIIVDDDLERLEDIRKGLKEAEREMWEEGAKDTLHHRFSFVGTWNEEHVTLIFSLSFALVNGGKLGGFKRWTTPGSLWKDILDIHPVLSQYQELARGQERAVNGGPLLGGGLFYREQKCMTNYSYNAHLLTLVVPFLGCSNALLFAHDFVTHYPSIDLELDGKTGRVDVRVVTMGPPALKDDTNWAGLVLRNYNWLDGLHQKFGGNYYGPSTRF